MKQQMILAVLLGILVLVSAVQAYQLNTLKSDIQESGLNVKVTGASTSSGPRQTGQLPSNIQNLPQMVGGC